MSTCIIYELYLLNLNCYAKNRLRLKKKRMGMEINLQLQLMLNLWGSCLERVISLFGIEGSVVAKIFIFKEIVRFLGSI